MPLSQRAKPALASKPWHPLGSDPPEEGRDEVRPVFQKHQRGRRGKVLENARTKTDGVR